MTFDHIPNDFMVHKVIAVDKDIAKRDNARGVSYLFSYGSIGFYETIERFTDLIRIAAPPQSAGEGQQHSRPAPWSRQNRQ